VNVGTSESVIFFSGYASAGAHPLPDTGAPMESVCPIDASPRAIYVKSRGS